MKIYVGNLSFETTADGLREKFSPHGEISDVSIVNDRDTGRSRGFGFVTMSQDDEAQAAIAALNGSQVDGRTLNVSEARPKAGGDRRRY